MFSETINSDLDGVLAAQDSYVSSGKRCTAGYGGIYMKFKKRLGGSSVVISVFTFWTVEKMIDMDTSCDYSWA